jgi:hypothetical protein
MQDTYFLKNERLGMFVRPDNLLENVEIFNFLTRTNVCAQGIQQFLVRRLDSVSEPILLDQLQLKKSDSAEIKIHLEDKQGQYSGDLNINNDESGIHFHLELDTTEHIWLFEWSLQGIEAETVIIPALGGQSINSQMPVGNQLSYKYPFWLNAQFIIGEEKSGGFYIRSEDESTDMKLVRIRRDRSSWTVTYGFEINSRSDLKSLTADWYLDVYSGDWKNAVEIHRKWLEKSFPVVDKFNHPHCPDWVKDIKVVLEIWGARRDSEVPHHSFDQMISRIKEWKNLYPPESTLLYLPGFAENGIDSHAPSYQPSERCGGRAKFVELVNLAHDLGFRVMIHTNVLAMTFTHVLFERFKKYQVVDIFSRKQSWGLDIDGDWLAEPFFAYMNPGYKAWSDLMTKTLGELIKDYQIDAVFLDQTLLAFNTKDQPDFIKGMQDHILRLQHAFPDILFAGEGLHEQNVACLPVAQIHGLDSIKDVHALDGEEPWRQVHPVSVHLFGKYTHYIPHLLTKHPSHPAFKFQESAYKELGIIPTLVLYDSEQEMDLPEVWEMIDRAKMKNDK